MLIGKEKWKRRINTTISVELADRLEKAGISFNYALAVGARKLLGDQVAVDEPYSALKAKIERLSFRLDEALSQKKR
jgi:hypothetical protein